MLVFLASIACVDRTAAIMQQSLFRSKLVKFSNDSNSLRLRRLQIFPLFVL